MRAIDADSLKKKIMEQYPDLHYPIWYVNLINEQPTITGAALRGKSGVWTHPYGDNKISICSECGAHILIPEPHIEYKFCPYCGTRMD